MSYVLLYYYYFFYHYIILLLLLLLLLLLKQTKYILTETKTTFLKSVTFPQGVLIISSLYLRLYLCVRSPVVKRCTWYNKHQLQIHILRMF